MRVATVPVSLGSGRDAWIEVDLDGLRFVVWIENGKTTREVVDLAELKRCYPVAANLIADVLAGAIRVSPRPI
jgi:hypothetical protein